MRAPARVAAESASSSSCDFEACFTHQFGDRWAVEPRGVVFDAQGVGFAVKHEMPDAVDLLDVRKREAPRSRLAECRSDRECPPWS